MKQAILNLKKKLLLVEIETFDPIKIIYEKNVGYFGQKMKLISKLTDITEEQFKEWVESFGRNRFRNYCSESQYYELLKTTAKESFFSSLEAKEIRFENKIEMPVLMFSDYDFGKEGASAETIESIEFDFDERMNQWQEAEEKVWNKDLIYIFEII